MHLSKILLHNFRLLKSVELQLEVGVTVIVGRNNSGKTSLTEFFRRVLSDHSPRFRLEDFSLGVHEQFWQAFQLFQEDKDERKVRNALPEIKAELFINYSGSTDFGSLSSFVIDLDLKCTVAKANVTYALDSGKIDVLFDGLTGINEKEPFFRGIKDRIPKLFKIALEAEDPNDPTNRRPLEFRSFET